jgi:hypothetical protein
MLGETDQRLYSIAQSHNPDQDNSTRFVVNRLSTVHSVYGAVCYNISWDLSGDD